MKKRFYKTLSGLAAMLLAATSLSGCQSGGGTPGSTAPGSNASGGGDGQSSAPAEQVFQVPQENKQLKLHYSPLMNNWLEEAVTAFKALYPDVEVVIDDNSQSQDWNGDAEQLRTELMSGQGPDLIYNPNNAFPDVHKTMKSGVFADLNPFFERDPDYKAEDFYQEVIKAGQYQGRQYVMPLIFNTTFLLSSKEALAEAEIDPANCGDYLGLAKEVEAYLKKGKEARVYDRIYFCVGFPSWLGLSYLDYETNGVDFSQPELRQAVESYKPLFPQDCPETDLISSSTMDGYNNVTGRASVFGTYDYGAGSDLFINASAISNKETPVLLPIGAVDGKTTGLISYSASINANSKNQQNAYRFLQVLMSKENQNIGINMGNLPIRKACLEDRITVAKEETDNGSINLGQNGEEAELLLPPLADSFYDQFRQAVDNMGHAEFSGGYVSGQVSSYMAPFYKGEKSYEACVSELTSAMEIYMSE